MIREDRFLISRKPFAIDLSTITGTQAGGTDAVRFSGHANAVWFRRKDGVIRPRLGSLMLWSHYLPAPLDLDDPRAILTADLDGRYGGDCDGRWDGTGYWGAETLDVRKQHLAVLQPMLANYPAIPEGYDGWWTFQAGTQ